MTPVTQIFVVHGALGSAAQMEPVVQALSELGTVHNIELPGHGNTALREGESFGIQLFTEALGASVKQRVKNASSSLPVVFGYSMGGYVALALEAEHPETFGAIVTLGTKFAWSPALALRELSRLDANVMLEKIPKFASVLEKRHEGGDGWKLMLERTGALLTQLGDRPVLTKETLAAVRSRVCIAVGELDDTVNAAEAAEYAGFIASGTSRVVAGAPHPIERVLSPDIVELVRNAIQ